MAPFKDRAALDREKLPAAVAFVGADLRAASPQLPYTIGTLAMGTFRFLAPHLRFEKPVRQLFIPKTVEQDLVHVAHLVDCAAQ